jgi:glycine/D-amino acid oxidase-like deaminating enzyme
MFATHAAAIHPARLARGLADVVERNGVRLFDSTTVTAIERGGVVTDRGRVRADVVVRATEGYTPGLAGYGRAIVPAQNFMIATEPLSASTWDAIGLADRPCFEDGRYLLFYGQRTADDRIAIGGLSVPYAWQSRVPVSPMPALRVHDRLHTLLGELFPMLTDVKVTHRWGGVLGIPRDWFPSVGFDRERGYAWGGGYVGEGVAAANLAGRTLADLICERDTDLVKLPWVNHVSPDWEPEPFRWLGLRGVAGVLGVVDRIEARTGRHQKWAEGLLGDGGR